MAAGRGRARTPTILQMEGAECGAAALAIVLAHHGRWTPLEELRAACNVGRDGSSARSIARAARAEGMEVQAFRAEPGDLRRLRFPLIAHWGMDHFVVVEGIGRRGVWLNDPATGPRRVTAAEFDSGFTGVVLAMQPGPSFRPRGGAPSLRRSLAARLDGSGGALAFVVLVSLALVVPGLMVPAFTRVFIDRVLIERFDHWLAPLLLGMAGCALAIALLTWLQREVLLRLETRLAVAGSLAFAGHVLRLPVAYFAQRQPAQVAGRTALNDRIAQLLAGEVGAAVAGLLTATAYLAAMLLFAPALGAVVLLLAAASLSLLAWSSRALRDDNRRLLAAAASHDGFALQGLRMIESYKAAGAEQQLRQRLVAMNARVLNLRQDLGAGQARLAALPGLTAMAAGGLVLAVGGNMVIAGDMTLGTLVAFQALLAGFLAPLAQLLQLGSRMQDAEACLRLLDDTLQHPAAPEFGRPEAGGPEHGGGRLAGAVAAEAIGFRHGAGGPLLLADVSFDLAPGELLGIAGASGAGKSTLAGLVAGLAEPVSGRVLLDGIPLSELPRQRLRRSLAYVGQSGAIFEGTLRDNITLWDETVPEERIVAAARLALLHDTALARGGYGARLREGGTNLSGGQRARLEIARALAREPAVLVLDEATAALDDETEAAVLSNLRRTGATILLVAHRWSALRECDRVLLLDAGRVAQLGPPARLLAEAGPFRRLMQAG